MRVGLVAVVCLLVLVPASAGASATRDLAAYEGAGSWVSVYDTRAWQRPQAVVRTLQDHGIGTLFLQTGNYRQGVDVVRPRVVGRFLELAHAAGISVVGWYLPSLADPGRDLRRALAAIRFRSPAGEAFDSFALDVEATVVRSIPRRNARAVELAAAVRRAAPAGYPLGAITIAPVGASPSYWRGYPFRDLAAHVDVFLPMTYFTARTRGPAGVRGYTAANIRRIRAAAGREVPIHPIGGETRRATPSELGAFLRAAAACETLGPSLWEYGETTARQWAVFAGAGRAFGGGC